MTTLASLPASIAVTNLTSAPLILANIRFEPGVAKTVTLTGMQPGYTSDVWAAIHAARTLATPLISTSPTTAALTNGVASGHTFGGGQDAVRAVGNGNDFVRSSSA